MKRTFSSAQVARASEVGHGECVASFTFGDLSRFCAKLCKTRFGEPCVFIEDADTRDERYPQLNVVVWQGTVAKLNEGIAFVTERCGNEVSAL